MERIKRIKKWIKKVMPRQENSEPKTNHIMVLNWRLDGLDDRDRSYLDERMDPDFGLLDKLLVSNVLTRRELNVVKSQATFEMRNAKLLDYIMEKKRFEDLADALIGTHQSHLVNYLDSRGVYESSFGGDWPLTDRETKILDSNQQFFVDKLETVDLVGYLVARHVINGRQRELLAAKQTTYEKSETLLDILRRGSLNDYRTLIDCLHQTNQSHVAQILERGGAVVSIHADFQENEDEEEEANGDVNQMEEEVVDRITHLLANRSPADSSRIWELVQLRLVGVQVGRSVVLFFYCQTASDLDELHRSYISGDLRQKVEMVFHRLLLRETQVLLRWIDDDIDGFRNQLLSLSVSQTTTETIPQQLGFDSSSMTSPISDEAANQRTESDTDRRSRAVTGINDLPFELLEMIVERFCLLRLTNRATASTFKDSDDVFVRMASVESAWFQLTRRPKFQRTLIRHLSILYSHLSRRSRIIRSNWTYLVDTLKETGEIVKPLQTLTDCLSDAQMRSLNRTKDHRRKTEEMLNLVKRFDAHRYSAFVRCLRQAGQRLPARIAENGGAVLKAMVRSIGNAERQRPRDQFRYLIQRINELQLKVKPSGEETGRLLKQLKSEGCEIYGATEDRGIMVLWICVQSRFTLATLNEDPGGRAAGGGPLSILERLLTHLCRSSYWNYQGQSIERRGAVVIDKEQLTTDVALSSTVIRLQKRLEETSYVHGIVRLNDSLYVLCHQPNAVRVYECSGDDAFPFQRQILLQLIVQPWDIAASSRSNCLYVTDSHNRCVWKIKESCGSQVAKWLHDVSSPQFTLSVTSNDQVLLVTGGAPRPSLEMYTPDAELARSIPLPGHVFSPVHAVVTTAGNFVVIYGWWNSKRWGICKLNSEGETVRQFIPMNDSQQLNCPWHLALDEDDGVFVADYENNRVIVLDSDLSWVKILLSQDNDGLTEPWRLLYYAGSRKLLVVAHLHKVDVYALTQT